MHRINGSAVVLAGLLFAAGPADAQQDACTAVVQPFLVENDVPATSVYAVLNSQRGSGCVLGPTDTTGIAERYQVLHDNSSSETTRAVARTQLFQLAIDEFAGRPSSICSARHATGCMIGRHLDRLRELREALQSSATDPADEIVTLNEWAVKEADGAIDISDIQLKGYLEQECSVDVSNTQCGEAIALSGSLMRTSLAMIQVITAHNRPMIEANAEFLSMRDREWDAYFNEISVQYPWELAINSRRFRRSTEGQLGSFPRAPESKLVVLHPSLGVERTQVPSDDTVTNAAVFLEVVGWERWNWRNGRAHNRWGLSIIASYADVPDMDRIGYGLLLHTPIRNVSVGAVRRDGEAGAETGIVVNVEIAALLNDYKNVDLEEFLTP